MPDAVTWAQRATEFWLRASGSTRPAGLMRVGLALLLWSRWANELAPYRDFSPERLALSASFFASTSLMLIGLWSRFATAWAALTTFWIVYGLGIWGPIEDYRHHHTYLLLVAVCLLALAPNGASYSVDRWLAVRRAEREGLPAPVERGEPWAVRLIGLELSVIYFWGAYDKTGWAFLSGDRMHHYWGYIYAGSDWPESSLVAAAMAVVAVLTVVIEYVLVVALWHPRLQPYAIAAGLVLHGLFYVLIPVGTFSATVMLLYLAVLDPDRVHRLIDRLHGVPPDEEATQRIAA